MAAEPWRVPEALWREIEPLIPQPSRRARYPGRKRWDERACLEGILYVLRYGIPWKELPRIHGFPSGKTCWRRLDEWEQAGVWALLMARLQARLQQANAIDWQRALVDASLVSVKKGGAATGPSPADRGRPSSKLHLCCDGRGVPLSVSVSPGNENERRQLLSLVDAIPALRSSSSSGNGNGNRPDRLLADRGYDSHALRAALQQRGLEPAIAARRGRGQGGAPDPQLKQRWTIEPTNAWLHNWRRIHSRWERRPQLYQALLQLACSMIICRRLAGAF